MSGGGDSCAPRRARPVTLVALVLVLVLALPCSAALGAPLNGGGGSGYAPVVPLLGSAGAVGSGPAQGGSGLRQPSPGTVLAIQRLFAVLGYPLGRERSGTFGVGTKGALSYFQRKYGLPITGYPDPRTVERMQTVAAALSVAPAGSSAPPRDLIDRLLGGVPIMGLGLACALGLALLALTARGGDLRADR
jgi:peptidoglycan hydrolase-like protein with peptidoglycan-binding domain